MPELAIRAQGISKRYRLGFGANTHPTMRDALTSAIKGLMREQRRPLKRSEVNADFWALKDVSFEAYAGEVIGIIGPNGAGKSTLLKILARIVEPTSGRAEIRGRLGALLEVGTGFHAELTGRENIYLNGAILGMRRAEIAAKLDQIVEFSGVEKFIDTPLKRYSSGMYLRLAFAVAAHVEPDILVIDEVLAVGDWGFQQKCIMKAEQVAQTGRTVLLVSHQMSIVHRLCTRAILIEGGRVLADGPTSKVIDGYLHSLDARASADLSMRTARSGRGGLRVVSIETTGDGNALISGRSATFRFQVNGPRVPAQCLVTILDGLGDPVTSFDSAEHSEHDRNGDVYTVEVPHLLLRPGRYRLDVALVAQDRVVEDHVETAAIFEVQPGVVDDRPATAGAGLGSACLPHRWVVRS